MPGIGELTALYEGDFVNGSGDFSIVVVLVLLPLSAEDEPLDGESLRGLFGFMRFAGANVGKQQLVRSILLMSDAADTAYL